jgi:acyl dehydratase
VVARFPTAGHLVSWAKLCPATIQSGTKKKKNGKSGKGDRYLKGVLGEVATAAAKTDTFLGERYRRLIKRMPKAKALVAPAAILYFEPCHFDAFDQAIGDRGGLNALDQWTFRGPVRIGDRLRLTLRLGDRWLKSGREYAEFIMDAENESGRVVATATFTEAWDHVPDYAARLPVRESRPPSRPSGSPGTILARRSTLFTREMSLAIAGPGDMHTDKELAQALGHPDAVLGGPQFVCPLSELVTDLYGSGFVEDGSIDLKLLKPVLVETVVTATVRCLQVTTRPDGVEYADLHVACEVENGTLTAVGTARARKGPGLPTTGDASETPGSV